MKEVVVKERLWSRRSKTSFCSIALCDATVVVLKCVPKAFFMHRPSTRICGVSLRADFLCAAWLAVVTWHQPINQRAEDWPEIDDITSLWKACTLKKALLVPISKDAMWTCVINKFILVQSVHSFLYWLTLVAIIYNSLWIMIQMVHNKIGVVIASFPNYNFIRWIVYCVAHSKRK